VDAITGIVSYDVKQGRSKLQLQVGSMALQVFKGGKPVDNMLYKDMASWQVSFCCICRCWLPAVMSDARCLVLLLDHCLFIYTYHLT
jgi:hypothetical protein